MASVFKCTGCKEYFPKDEVHATLGIQNFHSAECLRNYSNRKPAHSPRAHRPKRSRGTPIPQDIREAVLKRDKKRCRYCRTRSRLHVHHIIYRSGGGKHVAENLITLCNDHHDLIHSDKRRFQPLCQGVVWLYYYNGHYLTIPEYERWMIRAKNANE